MQLPRTHQLRIACVVSGLAATSAASAADFWTDPQLMQWPEKDVRKLLTNSPWAAEYAAPDPRAGMASAAKTVFSGKLDL